MCAAVRFVCATLLLVVQLRAGEGLKCYESSCLKDHSKKSLRCYEEDVSDMTLHECTPDFFTQRWSDVTKEKLSSGEMKCVKLEAMGALPKAQTGIDVIRMCAPKVQDMCDILGTLVSTKIEHSEVMDLKFKFACNVCETDGCNSAQRHTAISFVSFIMFGAAILATL